MSTRERDRLDPDELALLEEERDHLLASLEDLEREYAAGDLDEVDFVALRDDYTVRAAEVLDAIEHRRRVLHEARQPPNRTRQVLVAVAVLAFAVVAGVLVARSSGQRGDGAITGGTGDLRTQLATCRSTSLRDPEAGIDCYDAILADAPDHLEALTYQGWAMIRADRVREGAANFERVVELDPDYPDVRVFRAVVAARAGDHATAAAEIDRFYRTGPPPAAVQVLRTQGLEREVFLELLDGDARACWVEAAGAVEPGEETDEEDGAATAAGFLGALGTCLDGVLEGRPDAVDALVSRAYALLAAGSGELDEGAAFVERALAADPDDPDALLLRASIAVADERPDDARADLERLEGLPRPRISFLVGGPEELRTLLEEGAEETTTSTVPPGRSRIPNPDGG
ncbi:MAG TPA: tetratricopeptide repeat protein [Microthrixaceae bacterium]|nr:tetratricopeptide repeat protein [Microthrixaceae bacterium]